MHDISVTYGTIHNLRMQRRFAEAAKLFREVWGSIPDRYFEALLSLEYGICQFYLSNYSEASEYLKTAYSLRNAVPKSEKAIEFVTSYAWILLSSHAPDQLLALLSETEEEFKSNDELRPLLESKAGAYLYWAWGCAEVMRKQYLYGIGRFEQAIAILSGHQSDDVWCVVIDLADVYLKLDALAQARATLESVKMAELRNQMTSLWHKHYAVLLLKEGNNVDALSAAQQAYRAAVAGDLKKEMAESLLLEVQIKKHFTGEVPKEKMTEFLRLCSDVRDESLVADAIALVAGGNPSK